ncbi:alg3, alpha-1,3- mannosyltransferase [Rhodnius prolixus]
MQFMMGKNVTKSNKISHTQKLNQWFTKFGNVNFFKTIFLTSAYLYPVSILLLIGELVLSVLIVQNVKYTEIDWVAYMQEVEGFLNGTFDYSQLEGDTGPLVYPAGFVYIYSSLYYLTNKGANVRLAQYVFVGLYALTLLLVFRIYILTKKVPAYVLIIMCCTTYRIHSIFMLRLFNDPFAMTLLYLSINLFLKNKWNLGSIIYSFAVSVKMNILLFSPALLLAYIHVLGLKGAVVQLALCASVQVFLGLPFLITNPLAYIKGSFNLGRVFQHQWTVNWRFLPENIFIHPIFHALLFTGHIFTLWFFFNICNTFMRSYSRLKYLEGEVAHDMKKCASAKVDMSTLSQLFVFPMFLANLIGVVFSRSLHYQFYIWYYHSLPYLLWCTDLSVTFRLMLLGLIELSWNTYPSTIASSTILHFTHIVILFNVYKTNAARLKAKI